MLYVFEHQDYLTSFHALCRRRQNLLQGVIDLGPHIQIGRPSQRTDHFDGRGEGSLFDEGGLNGEKGFVLVLMQGTATHAQQQASTDQQFPGDEVERGHTGWVESTDRRG